MALDDTPIAPSALGTDLLVDPGKHVVTVNAPGLPEKRYELKLDEGKRTPLLVEAGAPKGSAIACR